MDISPAGHEAAIVRIHEVKGYVVSDALGSGFVLVVENAAEYQSPQREVVNDEDSIDLEGVALSVHRVLLERDTLRVTLTIR